VSSTVTNYSNQINANFPVAGEDNDSQGFRSNFSRIQNAFLSASKEITELQTNSVSLSAQNDFSNNVIKRAALQGCSEVVNDAGSFDGTTASITVNYAEGSYQQYEVDPAAYVFTVDNWPPSGKLGTIRLEITPTSASTSTISFGGPVTFLDTSVTQPVPYTQTTPIVWELFSPDGGDAKILAWQVK
jgi:hypothetical protein